VVKADMKVLLRSDISGVGKRGDIIDVSGGFARNHLLPGGKAIVASPGVEGQAASMRRSRDLRDARDRESSETVARTLVGHTITVTARAGAAGKLFGSVSAADIVREVESQTGAVVDRKDLVLDEPIKETGAHNIRVELSGGVIFELNVEVVTTD
jgi:large subunit ribosomal protein L9